MNTLTVKEIEEAVEGGPASAAMEKVVAKLKRVRRAPKLLDDPGFRDCMLHVLGNFTSRPDAKLFAAMGAEAPIEAMVKTFKKMEVRYVAGKAHAL